MDQTNIVSGAKSTMVKWARTTITYCHHGKECVEAHEEQNWIVLANIGLISYAA